MKRAAYFVLTAAFLCAFSGCSKQASDEDAIRDGINQHLSGLKTINPSAMTVNIRNYSVQGNQATADVEFLPKAGGAPGTGMQVSYTLEKQNGAWIVQNTQPHPPPGSNPNMMPNASASSGSSGSMPNFRDLVPGGGGGGNGNTQLPAGHPPINGQNAPSTQTRQ